MLTLIFNNLKLPLTQNWLHNSECRYIHIQPAPIIRDLVIIIRDLDTTKHGAEGTQYANSVDRMVLTMWNLHADN